MKRALVMLAVLALASLAPTAAGYTVVQSPGSPTVSFGTLSRDGSRSMFLNVTVACQSGNAPGDIVAVEFSRQQMRPMRIDVPELYQSRPGPVLCTGGETFEFSANATVRFDDWADAERTLAGTLTANITADDLAQTVQWTLDARQAFHGAFNVTPPPFEVSVRPGATFEFSYSVLNDGNARVRVEPRVRVLTEIEPATLTQSNAFELAGHPAAASQRRGNIDVSGSTESGFRQANETIVLELGIQVAPAGDVPEAEAAAGTFHRLYVMHVNIRGTPVAPTDEGGSSPAPGALALVIVLVGALWRRRRQ